MDETERDALLKQIDEEVKASAKELQEELQAKENERLCGVLQAQIAKLEQRLNEVGFWPASPALKQGACMACSSLVVALPPSCHLHTLTRPPLHALRLCNLHPAACSVMPGITECAKRLLVHLLCDGAGGGRPCWLC